MRNDHKLGPILKPWCGRGHAPSAPPPVQVPVAPGVPWQVAVSLGLGKVPSSQQDHIPGIGMQTCLWGPPFNQYGSLFSLSPSKSPSTC